LELCLENESSFISNHLSWILECAAMSSFLQATGTHVSWTEAEDKWLLHDWLRVGWRGKLFAKSRPERSEFQRQNR
jgi:hypothetical protein